MAGYFIGVDLGGTNIKLGCFDEAMALVGRTSVPTDADMGPDHVIGNIINAGQKLLKKAKLTEADLAAIGIGTPGHMPMNTNQISAISGRHETISQKRLRPHGCSVRS